MTFPAHQGLIVPVKLKWPNAIDGTALCIGAATPDVAYALGPWLNAQSHTALGVLLWALPFTLLSTSLVRWRAASGIFAALPDAGRLQLRSYRVLGTRRPSAVATVMSALLGAASHVIIDGFTHAGRFGSNLLDLNDVLFTAPIRGEMTGARVLQYIGHFGGSAAFIVALLIVASSGRLSVWYGHDAVAEARAVSMTRLQRTVFWTIIAAFVGGATVFASATGRSTIFVPVTVLVFALLATGVVFGGIIDTAERSHRRTESSRDVTNKPLEPPLDNRHT